MIDYATMLYGPLYANLGAPAILAIPSTDFGSITLTAIDKTAGVLVDAASERGHARSLQAIQVQTVRPCVDVRISELIANDVGLELLKTASITLYPATENEKTWVIRTHALIPGPAGESAGEVRLILIEEDL